MVEGRHPNAGSGDTQQRDVVLLAGPTASGKSALAIALAERIGGLIINADSMQVYADLRILTARPSPEDETRVPHALYGFVDAADAYSVGRYVADVPATLARADALGLVPIFVGGTGMYFKALEDGLAPVPTVAPDIRQRWRSAAEAKDARELHADLSARDPVMAARLRPTDTQRIVRALEVYDSTGRSLADWQALPHEPSPLVGRRLVTARLMPDRQVLRERASMRLRSMLDAGGLDEAARLAKRALPPDLPAMRAIGVPPLIAAARGGVSPEAALAQAEIDTHQYIKRQSTWLNGKMIAWNSISEKEMESPLAQIITFIES